MIQRINTLILVEDSKSHSESTGCEAFRDSRRICSRRWFPPMLYRSFNQSCLLHLACVCLNPPHPYSDCRAVPAKLSTPLAIVGPPRLCSGSSKHRLQWVDMNCQERCGRDRQNPPLVYHQLIDYRHEVSACPATSNLCLSHTLDRVDFL